ncbi:MULTISPECIES: SirB2 family protein [unclassified Moraxella]|uniref:SirB2 family protein n=1 Tax=unclassified Moraxella TaxID=2685852 RepID=UPI002B411224|nr:MULTISPECIES: SirB2 family protein [unclassified Moraxella]
MKHLHLLMAFFTLLIFAYQAVFVVSGKQLILSRTFKGINHLVYLLLVSSGLMLFWQLTQVAGLQHWAIAKLVLLIVAISANVKALRPASTIGQSKAGMLIAAIAYVGVIILALTKPVLG